MTKNTPKPIVLDLTLDECGIVHDALLSLPMRRVERLVGRIRAAASAAVQEAQPAGGCGGCHAAAGKSEEPTP